MGDEVRCQTTSHPEPVACRVVGFAEGQEWGLRVAFVEARGGVGPEPVDQSQLAEWRAAVESRRPRASVTAPALWLGTGALGEPPAVIWGCVDYARAADAVLLGRPAEPFMLPPPEEPALAPADEPAAPPPAPADDSGSKTP